MIHPIRHGDLANQQAPTIALVPESELRCIIVVLTLRFLLNTSPIMLISHAYKTNTLQDFPRMLYLHLALVYKSDINM